MRLLFLDQRQANLVAAALIPLDLRAEDAAALTRTLCGDGLGQWSFLSSTVDGDWTVLTLDHRLGLACDDWGSVPEARRREIDEARKRLTRYARRWELGKPASLLRLRLSSLAV